LKEKKKSGVTYDEECETSSLLGTGAEIDGTAKKKTARAAYCSCVRRIVI
jgi:hypothetical protein